VQYDNKNKGKKRVSLGKMRVVELNRMRVECKRYVDRGYANMPRVTTESINDEESRRVASIQKKWIFMMHEEERGIGIIFVDVAEPRPRFLNELVCRPR
jgi:hypothetical protein